MGGGGRDCFPKEGTRLIAGLCRARWLSVVGRWSCVRAFVRWWRRNGGEKVVRQAAAKHAASGTATIRIRNYPYSDSNHRFSFPSDAYDRP